MRNVHLYMIKFEKLFIKLDKYHTERELKMSQNYKMKLIVGVMLVYMMLAIAVITYLSRDSMAFMFSQYPVLLFLLIGSIIMWIGLFQKLKSSAQYQSGLGLYLLIYPVIGLLLGIFCYEGETFVSGSNSFLLLIMNISLCVGVLSALLFLFTINIKFFIRCRNLLLIIVTYLVLSMIFDDIQTAQLAYSAVLISSLLMAYDSFKNRLIISGLIYSVLFLWCAVAMLPLEPKMVYIANLHQTVRQPHVIRLLLHQAIAVVVLWNIVYAAMSHKVKY